MIGVERHAVGRDNSSPTEKAALVRRREGEVEGESTLEQAEELRRVLEELEGLLGR